MSVGFLNTPRMVDVPGEDCKITLDPLVFQYAGDDAIQGNVDPFINSWRDGYHKDMESPKLYLEGLAEYFFPLQTVLVIPAGRVTDGPSVPRYLHWMINPKDFYLSGVFHDWARGYFITGNATTDGFLRDAAASEGMGAIKSYLIYLGVRIGTHTGYKCSIPDSKAVRKAYAGAKKVPVQDIWFDADNFEVKYKR